MTALEHLDNFLEAIKDKDITVDDARKYLTKTQFGESKFLSTSQSIGALAGLHSLFSSGDRIKDIKTKEKPSSNKVVTDCVITCKLDDKKLKIQCRLVKEIDIRKPSIEGTWGINSSSFKYM